LTKWFIAIYFFTTNKRGISSVQLSKWIGVTQRTAWFMLHRLREALKEENNIILSGIVEVDETFIGPDIRRDTRLQKLRRLHNEEQDRIHGYGVKKRRTIEGYRVRGRKKGDTPEMLEQRKKEKEEHLKKYGKRKQFERVTVVLGMLERGGRLVMKRLGHSSNTVNREAIFPHLKRHIHRDSTLFTDQHIVYIEAKDMFKWHYSVNHEVGYVVDGIHTNGIENAWKHLKKLLDATYFHVSNRHFDRYLDEYTYRWNKQNESDKVLFESFIPFVINKRLSFNGLKQEEIRLAA
jgi:transposase-like protein